MDISLIFERNPWRTNRTVILDDDLVTDAFSRKHRPLYTFEKEENLIFICPRRVLPGELHRCLAQDTQQ